MEATQSTVTAQVAIQKYQHEPQFQACLTQHSVLQVTLTGPALIFTIISVMVAIQILQPSLTCTLIALGSILWIIHNDYENFILLGPGGTPATFLGYLTITYLRMFALSDTYSPAVFPDQVYPTIGYYQRAQLWLPSRHGPRPKIAGIAPHRQINQPGCSEMYHILRASLQDIAFRHPESYRIGQSCFEKKGLALFAQNPINATCRGEICHVHHSDRSMHMNLHPDDAKVVLEKGWGERHPLARGGWMKAYVPREFVMVYAPRDQTELGVVCRIIEAAGYWVSGEDFEIKLSRTDIPERDPGVEKH